MRNEFTEEQIKDSFERIVGPLVARVRDLENHQQEKSFEILVLRNAYENMIKELDEYKEKMKRLPKR